MHVLVINSGSSSIKYRLFEMTSQGANLVLKGVEEKVEDYPRAIQNVIDQVTLAHRHIDAVGHRIVHGGDLLREPVLIDEKVIQQIEQAGRFAPLHCEPNLSGIRAVQKRLPCVSQVAVFDTAAFAYLDRKAFLYAIPVSYYENHHIRKYGFHGINHSYVASQAAQILGSKESKIITCHLGNGCSIAAFHKGKSVDTSMGFTPLEGLVMGTRSGDLDPSVVLYMIDVLGLSTKEVTDVLNQQSGLLGLCGKQDMRDILAQSAQGDKWSTSAFDLFVYRLQKYIGAYIAVLNGVDAIVFTGGIGEHSPEIRNGVMANFGYMDINVAPEKNQSQQTIFSSDDSKVLLLNIPANEELVIAEQTYQVLAHSAPSSNSVSK